MSTRDLLALTDLASDELLALLERAAALKAGEDPGRPLAGKALAMIFHKASTRTRVSFEVGVFQLGGHPVLLDAQGTQMGRGESIEDTGQVLGRYVDGIMIRTFAHADLERLAAAASVPVINGLTDHLHPCQVLADLLTCREAFGPEALGSMRVAWIGDGNNMARSWVNASACLGFELVLCSPKGYRVDDLFLARARAAGARITEHHSPRQAAAYAHVVTTDTWASMGQESEAGDREQAFAELQVDEAVMAEAYPEAIFLHCLPAYRGKEVAAAVIDGPQSRIFDEAENRLHAQKAVLEWLLGGRPLRRSPFRAPR